METSSGVLYKRSGFRRFRSLAFLAAMILSLFIVVLLTMALGTQRQFLFVSVLAIVCAIYFLVCIIVNDMEKRRLNNLRSRIGNLEDRWFVLFFIGNPHLLRKEKLRIWLSTFSPPDFDAVEYYDNAKATHRSIVQERINFLIWTIENLENKELIMLKEERQELRQLV